MKMFSSDSPIPLGLVGCGNFGLHLASKVANSHLARVTVCYDPLLENAGRAGALIHAEAVPKLEDLWAREEVRAVLVVTPNSQHRPLAVAALQAGRHVFIEKPIANTIADAEAILEASTIHNKILAIGHNGRRKPGHRMMKQMLSENRIGRIVAAEANFSRNALREIDESSWRFSAEECPAPPLTQLGIHHIDTLRYLLGDIVEVTSLMSQFAITGDNVDNTVTALRFASGALASLTASYVSGPGYHIRLQGERGALLCENGRKLSGMDQSGKPLTLPPVEEHDDLQEEIEEFARCSRDHRQPEVGGIEGLAAVRVLHAALESAKTGQSVQVTQ
jgi:predicted dehydrogenase